MKPSVGLLYNPAIPGVLEAIGSKVDHLEVVPDRLWYDNGFGTPDRFSLATEAIQELQTCSASCQLVGHGIGLSLPSAIPLDEDLLCQVKAIHGKLHFLWYSEHLSMFLVPGRSVPNAQSGLGLPILMNEDTLQIMTAKIHRLVDVLETTVLIENPTIFTEIPEQPFTEPEFLNELHRRTGSGILLDLHNLYANTINLNWDAHRYLNALDPDLVQEIHLAGGDVLHRFHTDSHSQLTPDCVWQWAYEFAPRFRNLRAITFEYHESYHPRFGIAGVEAELDRMHALAEEVSHAY